MPQLRAYDFQCEDGHVTEHFVTDYSAPVRCGCGKEARRIISPVAFKLPPNSGFPGKDMRWIAEHEKAGGQIKAKYG